MLADAPLARRLEQTEGAAGAAFVKARGGTSCHAQIAGADVMFDGVDSPLSQTFGLGMSEPVTETALSEIEDFFRARGAMPQHEICPLAGIPLLQMLATRGYVPCEVSNVLFLSFEALVDLPALNPTLTVRTAEKSDGDVYARVAAGGWGDTPEIAAMVGEMSRLIFSSEGYIGFLASQGEEVIATAGLIVHQGAALLAGASTVPAARGQGAQRTLLAARLKHAREMGCDLAMMVAEPGSASQRNAERSGFRVAYTRTKWLLTGNKT